MRQLAIHGAGLIILISLACCLTSCSGPKSPAGEVLEYMADDPKWPDRQDAGIEKLKAMGSEAIDPIVAFYRRHSRWPWGRKREVGRLALECIASVRQREALPKLIKLATDKDNFLSLCAVYGIRGVAAREDVENVIRLIEDPRFVWHDRLPQLLGELGGEQARKALLRHLNDPRGRARRGACLGLEALGDRSVIAEVRRMFEAEKNPQLRIAAAETLAALGDDMGATYLATVLEGNAPDYILWTAAYASGRVKGKKAVPGLIKLLDHPEWYCRHVAREALTMIGTDEALSAIEQRLPKEEREFSLSSEAKYFYSFDRDPFMDWSWVYRD